MILQEYLQAQSQEGFVTGHDFSRAAKASQNEPALAAAKLQPDENGIAGAKAQQFFAALPARLKSCPDTKLFIIRSFRHLLDSCLR